MLSTQLESFNGVRETRNASQTIILHTIKMRGDNGATLFELVNELGWPVNRISGRVTELASRELVYPSLETRVNPDSGKKGIVWKAKLTE